MKKLLTFIMCFMIGITLVKAEPPLYRLGITTTGLPAGADNYVPGDTFNVSVHLEAIVTDESVNQVYLPLVYDRNIFEIKSNVNDIQHPSGWNLTVENDNPTYGINEFTYSEPTTGYRYLLSSTTNSYTMDNTNNGELIILASNIEFKVKENAPVGKYRIYINPKYPAQQGEDVDYDSFIEITVLGGALHNCIIDAYNAKNSANKTYDAVLTDAELATITDLSCLIGDNQPTATINEVSEIKKMVNLETLKLNRIAEGTSLDFKENTKLKELSISGVNSSIKVDSNTLLEKLTIDSLITSLDLSKNTNLKTIDLTIPRVRTLDLTNNTELTDITISAPLRSLDLSKNTKLESLSLNENSEQLNAVYSALDLSKNTKLKADKLKIENGILRKTVKIKLNESISLPHIVTLPSHINIVKTVVHSGKYVSIENNKIVGKKVTTGELIPGEDVSVDYYIDDTNYFTETFEVEVTKVSEKVTNPKTGVFDVSAFIVIIALLSYFLYRSTKDSNVTMNLQK